MALQWDTAQIPRKVFPEAQDIPRHGSGDLLKNRFGLMSWEDTHWHKDSTGSLGKAGKLEDVSQAIQVWGALRVFPGGDQVDGLPPAPSNSVKSL